MLVRISSRHMDVSPALAEFARVKASKLSRYYDRIQDIEVVFDAAKEAIRVEVIVIIEHRTRFVAHQNADDAYGCIDDCVEKLERRLSEHKKKFRNRKHATGPDKRVMGGTEV